eukprot:15950589-Heterocapsa_arctica.AAC.1
MDDDTRADGTTITMTPIATTSLGNEAPLDAPLQAPPHGPTSASETAEWSDLHLHDPMPGAQEEGTIYRALSQDNDEEATAE